MKYNHSKSFYDTRYSIYKARVRAIGGTVLKKNEFISAYNAISGESKNPMKDIVYGSKYGTRYATAVAEHKALKGAGIKVKLEDLKTMTTQDFAAIYAAELSKAYRELKASGATGAMAKTLISQQWFGSK